MYNKKCNWLRIEKQTEILMNVHGESDYEKETYNLTILCFQKV